ncbi:MAG TPA: hypothetical protein VF765_11995 [Polyangiaceae bacterium]
MARPSQLIALICLLLAAGCSSSSSSGASDAGVVDSCAPIDGSICGQPCQTGNSLGVGAFCNSITECTHLPQAHLCASLGDPNAHFCTFECSLPPEGGAGDGGEGDAGDASSGFPTNCGEGATCTCDNSGNCGCTPNTCLGK